MLEIVINILPMIGGLGFPFPAFPFPCPAGLFPAFAAALFGPGSVKYV